MGVSLPLAKYPCIPLCIECQNGDCLGALVYAKPRTQSLWLGAKLYAERSIPTLAIVKYVCVVAMEVCHSDV